MAESLTPTGQSEPQLVIRPMRPEDRVAVGRIAFQTGFFGRSALPYFPDEELFADLWVGPYFQGAGAACFVSEVDGEITGYVLGSSDHLRYDQALWQVLLRRVLPATGRLRAWAGVPYLLRAGVFPVPHASWGAFPAHLHINLLPGMRGLGVGEKLLRAHLSALVKLGVRGVQLSTTAENAAALKLYRKLGFHIAVWAVTPLWTPWLGHPAEHLVMALTLPSRAD